MTPEKPPEKGPGDDASRDLWQLLNKPTEVSEEQSSTPGGDGQSQRPDSAPAESYRELHPEQYIPQDSDPVGPVSDDASTIQKILLDPESVEGIDYTASGEEDGDYDTAIREYYRERGVLVTCRDHPEREAADRCPECEAYYCQECIVVRRGRLLCRSCAEALFTPTEEEILMAQEQGLEMPPPEVTPKEAPEFEVGGAMFGLEGQPASPLKRLIALGLDLLLTRVILAGILFLLGVLFESNPNELFTLFDTVDGESTLARIGSAFFLFQPVMPWLIMMAIIDFLYFFLTNMFTNRTFGMSWVGCRLVTEWGDYVSAGAVAMRTLVFMVFLGWPAILIGIFFPAYRGPHDYVAGTIVINYAGVKRVDAYETVQIKL
jgi:uncharacterized RDD family membrane protein YckC